MTKSYLLFIALLSIACSVSAQNIAFPLAAEGKGWVDVTKPPYNAPKDGTHDATAALNKALIDNSRTGKRIYLPKK